METRNVLLAVILSTIILVFWATFFEAPIVEQQAPEEQITKKQNGVGGVSRNTFCTRAV